LNEKPVDQENSRRDQQRENRGQKHSDEVRRKVRKCDEYGDARNDEHEEEGNDQGQAQMLDEDLVSSRTFGQDVCVCACDPPENRRTSILLNEQGTHFAVPPAATE
jgi:hypothetical protein